MKIIFWKLLKIKMEKIDKIYYINLEERKDRREHILGEIKKMEFELKKVKRLDAIKHKQGGIGCGLSHIKVLEDAIENNYKNIIILEDDFKFLVEREEFEEYLKFLFNYDFDYNTCMLTRYIVEHKKLNDKISEVIYGKTVSGIIVNNKFFEDLKENFQESVNEMMKGCMDNPHGYSGNNNFAIDENWKKLQGIGKKFYTFNKPLGTQIPSYSNIVNQVVDYKNFLTKIL